MSNRAHYDHLFKILIVGESGVGKTAIMQRLCEDTYDNVYISTVGVDFKPKILSIRGKTVKMQIWDTAGQERFRNITASYYRNAQGVIIVYDVNDVNTLEKVDSWFNEVKERTGSNPPIIFLVGNKSDCPNPSVSKEMVKNVVAKLGGVPEYTCSAKEGTRVSEVFTTLAETMMNKVGKPTDKQVDEHTSLTDKPTSKSGCC
ncbi:Sphingomyelin phosphodiesterase [Entamoeba marina]